MVRQWRGRRRSTLGIRRRRGHGLLHREIDERQQTRGSHSGDELGNGGGTKPWRQGRGSGAGEELDDVVVGELEAVGEVADAVLEALGVDLEEVGGDLLDPGAASLLLEPAPKLQEAVAPGQREEGRRGWGRLAGAHGGCRHGGERRGTGDGLPALPEEQGSGRRGLHAGLRGRGVWREGRVAGGGGDAERIGRGIRRGRER